MAAGTSVVHLLSPAGDIVHASNEVGAVPALPELPQVAQREFAQSVGIGAKIVACRASRVLHASPSQSAIAIGKAPKRLQICHRESRMWILV